MNVKGIIFDLDDTLISSVEAHKAAFKQAAEERGHELEKMKWEYGQTGEEMLKLNFPNMDEGEVKRIWELKQNLLDKHIDKVRLLDEGRELLDWLESKSVKLALVTSDREYEMNEILKHLDMDKYFDVKVDVEDAPKKPNPDPIVKALDKMGVRKEDAIYIGDSKFDVEAAKDAGVKVFIHTQAHEGEEIMDADYVFKDLDGIKQMLKGVLK